MSRRAAGRAAHPPKPVLTLRVGITGHRPRPERFPLSVHDRVKGQLGMVFEAIDSALRELHSASRSFYSPEPHRVRLVSGLAEGADQMSVRARPRNWAVDAILPFPRASYIEDFRRSAIDYNQNVEGDFTATLAEAEAVLELPEIEDPTKRDLGYGRLGSFLVRQVDLLVAVWDGRPEDGIGGTAQVIRQAITAHVPVVWITALPAPLPGHELPRMIESLEKNGTPLAPPVDCTKGPLRDAISSIVILPVSGTDKTRIETGATEVGSISDRLSNFLREPWPTPSRWILYDLYRRCMERKSLRLQIPVPAMLERLTEWDQFLEDAPHVEKLKARLITVLLPRYVWADQLAIDVANKYRSAYALCYFLAALAVLIALLGVWLHVEPQGSGTDPLFQKWVLVVIELIVILFIIGIYRKGKKQRWHEKWIEYRALAEMLRGSRFLAYLAEYGRIQRADAFEASAAAWFLWYLRATVRELGLPHGVLDGTYQYALLTAVERHVVKDQLKYHQRNASTLSRMNDLLHKMIDGCFIMTLTILVLFFLIWPIGLRSVWLQDKINIYRGEIMHSMTFIAALLPALGAALAGIRDTGDFHGFAHRSVRTVTALKNVELDLITAKHVVSLDDTNSVLVATAEVLTEDLAAWQSLYSGKRLTLPV